ncbi:MAG: sigma-70 family RNA polymerase sigma factor [Planctomycetaceae bacterium]|nr:sigma-70 family RNA polymerase sigma factor [Planctomycetaceae bacterium]
MAPNPKEQDLVNRVRSGDEAAWRECIALYEGRLTAFVVSRLRDRALAEDLVQDTFLGFLNALPNYDDRTPLDSFLFAITAHKITDHLRKQGRRPSLRSISGETGSAATGSELSGRARKASSLARSQEQHQSEELLLASVLSELIEQWQAAGEYERLMCAELLLVCGHPNKEVAGMLGITEQAVANHKYFIVSKLKAAAEQAHLHDWDPIRLGLE